jgi:predicted N-acetyltransferase YhbS
MADAITDRSWVVEAYRPGDEAHILDLFRREFGVDRSLAHWQWKFLENPYGGPFISLAWHRDDRFLVGNQVLMPFPLHVDGARVLAGHSLDLVVHRDFRRQGVFEHTGRHAIEALRRAGGAALVAFPNASSYPGFVRTLGWRRIVEPTLWVLRLGLRRKLERKIRSAGVARLGDHMFRAWGSPSVQRALEAARAETPDVRVTASWETPTATDALWAREARAGGLSIWKDRTYLTWRYQRHPDHRFTFHALERNAELVGLGVSVVRDGIALLCEVLVPGRDHAIGRRLVLEMCQACNGAGAEEVRFLGHDHDQDFLAAVFRGFSRVAAPENVFVGRAIANESLTERMGEAAAWTLSYGDGDFV